MLFRDVGVAMDDRKIFELTRLKLAYQKQIVFIIGWLTLTILGVILYVYNIYSYNFSLFIVSIVMMATGFIGIMTVDQKIKTISGKIKGL
jgi:hypothetical protein